MATASANAKSGTPATVAPYFTFHAGANRCFVQQILLSVATAVATEVIIIRPNNTPVASTTVAGVPLGATAPTVTGNIGTAWSTAPTVGSNVPIDGAAMAGTVGTGFTFSWDFGDGIEVPANGSLVVWNIASTTGPAVRATFRWREG